MADYTVQSGDTLSRIAKAHGTTVEKLCELNGIEDANKIMIGQELSLGKVSEDTPKAEDQPAVNVEELQNELEKTKAELEATQKAQQEEGFFERSGKVLDEGVTWVDEKFESGKEVIADAYKDTKEFVTETVPEKAEKLAYGVVGAGKEVVDFVDEKIDQGKEVLAEAYKDAKEGVNNTIDKAGEVLAEAYKDTEEFVTETVPEKAEKLAYGVVGAGKEVVDFVDKKIDQGKEVLAEAYKDAKEGVNDAIKWTDKKVDQAGDLIADAARDTDNAIRETARDVKESVKEGFEKAKVDVPEKTDRTQALADAEGADKLELEGREVVENAKIGLANRWNNFVDSAQNAAGKVYKGAKEAYNWFTGLFK